MLDTTTKQKIDSLRNLLVGKVPDPKSQVEQITVALFYKFMWDRDKEIKDLGGNATFFVDEFEKYSWENLFAPELGGSECIKLYSEAIEEMENNPNIPSIFRDIFKRAFLPYNDPYTLRLFLKEINDFHYSNSEKLGDGFEYLLSILGTQGDAGQFRTPRHIIDFITEVVNPQKGDRICDPACGTAGFIISAYKHVLKTNTKESLGDLLTPEDKKRLGNNLIGLDIDPMMVKLALANMYLHGLNEPHIYEYDTLTSEERWDETYDVVLANPPFMSPSGGIRPHNRFSVSTNRAEFLFVNYINNCLNKKGRSGIIVPEGFMFKNNSRNYKDVRKDIIENGLFAVISLPSGIFLPYSPIRTFIILIDKQISKLTSNILFLDIENDGYELNVNRGEINDNDLPKTLTIIDKYRKQVQEGINHEESSSIISKQKIIQNDSILIKEKYLKQQLIKSNYNYVELASFIDYEQPTKYSVKNTNYDDKFITPVLTAGKTFILGYTDEKEGIFKENLPVIIFDDFTTSIQYVDFPFKVKSSAMKILHIDKSKALTKFVYFLIKEIDFNHNEHKRYWISEFSKIRVPLPPIEIQKNIINEIDRVENSISLLKQEINLKQDSIKLKIKEILKGI